MLEVLEAIKGRRSVRSFLSKDVSKSQIETIIECATSAPSAGNLQPWEFIIVRSPERRKALARAALNQDFIEEAPVVIVVLADQARSARVYGRRGAELFSIQDTAAAIQNMLLTAYSMGLGTCWVGAFNEDEVSEIVKAHPPLRPVAIIPVGYPRYHPTPVKRMPPSKVMHEEVYKGSKDLGREYSTPYKSG
ncbi:MAG: nitroreductase family protein [Candidatus Bathyarchaeia archaeon]